MALKTYQAKRNFKQTSEPKGKVHKAGKRLVFVIQKHQASHLHYDFRLEMEGVLKSWAVPKGPSLDPAVKRLAMEVEDHPFDYKDFEGSIPEGNYGAGDVIVWDNGLYASSKIGAGEKDLLQDYKKGHISFVLLGKKLKGEFALIRTSRKDKEGNRKQWLLVKADDEFASTEDIALDTASVLTKKTLPGDTAPKRRNNESRKMPQQSRPVRVKEVSENDLKPMLATLTDQAFDDPDWIFETKWDGYRTLVVRKEETITLFSRNGLHVTHKYPEIQKAFGKLKKDCVIDGELVALDSKGKPSFQLMQNGEMSDLVFCAFDILFLDGKDMRQLPLLERKRELKKVLPRSTRIRYSEHLQKSGIALFKKIEGAGLEGVMAKRASSVYESGRRSRDWLKIKTEKRQEAVVIGYTKPRNSRQYVGSLVLAVRDKREWRYVGHTGGSMGGKSLKEVYELLKPLETKKETASVPREVEKNTIWVMPKIVVEVKFTEWTEEKSMRHPVIVGFRNDKEAPAVILEKEVPVKDIRAESKPKVKVSERGGLALSNLEKVYWPKEGYTKGDVIKYYERIADIMLPYLKGRPLVLYRHPRGIGAPGFFQKDTSDLNLPDFVRTTTVHSESNNKEIRYVVPDNKETLLYAANLGCIEMNVWNSRVESLDRPDFYVIDLDPGDNTFDEVVEVAQVVHEVLDLSCEESYPKTSGKTGLHIYVPLKGKYPYERVRSFAELVVRIVHSRLPRLTSLERSPAKRKDKIYLDWLQNRTGQTLAAPYSLRPVPGAQVSTPLEWREVKKGLDPKSFTIATIFDRVKKKGDLWKPVLGKGVDLAGAIVCLEKELK